MSGLLADGWFYISSAGLLVSGVLFFFLLGQYRAAGDAADQHEPEAAAEPHAPMVRPLYIPDEPVASPKIASVTAEKPADKAPAAALPEPKRDAPPAQAEVRRETSTGGVNPAVVYLQNIKNQLEEIHKENRVLAQRVDAIAGRDEALIERLGELAQAVADLKGANFVAPAAAPVEPPAPKRAKKSETPAAVLFPKAEAPSEVPAAAPVAEPVVEAVVEPVVEAAAPPPVAAEVPPPPVERVAPPAAQQEPEADEKPRRGPVWPV
ncbi:MAG: hypothetical protein ACHQ2Z_06505 [Elusimicrobiota bacterium]